MKFELAVTIVAAVSGLIYQTSTGGNTRSVNSLARSALIPAVWTACAFGLYFAWKTRSTILRKDLADWEANSPHLVLPGGGEYRPDRPSRKSGILPSLFLCVLFLAIGWYVTLWPNLPRAEITSAEPKAAAPSSGPEQKAVPAPRKLPPLLVDDMIGTTIPCSTAVTGTTIIPFYEPIGQFSDPKNQYYNYLATHAVLVFRPSDADDSFTLPGDDTERRALLLEVLQAYLVEQVAELQSDSVGIQNTYGKDGGTRPITRVGIHPPDGTKARDASAIGDLSKNRVLNNPLRLAMGYWMPKGSKLRVSNDFRPNKGTANANFSLAIPDVYRLSIRVEPAFAMPDILPQGYQTRQAGSMTSYQLTIRCHFEYDRLSGDSSKQEEYLLWAKSLFEGLHNRVF